MTEYVDKRQVPSGNPAVLWHPVVGKETIRLLESSQLDDAGEANVRAESCDVLARCSPPDSDLQRTGLVVGYVQSGKTLSFTTVISLARDNGFPLIVLLAGTKQNLHTQTSERLSHDLAVERKGGLSPWAMLGNPGKSQASVVAQNVKSMMDPAKAEPFRRATVITVMKNPARLNRVRELLEALPQYGLDLAKVPVLIIDDEADQAGLNAAVNDPDKDATATYEAIVSLRKALDRHTYLMYTATPQAPLLVNLADVLSPDFVYVLTPGSGYAGGQYFFVDHKDAFLKAMHSSAVTAALAATEPTKELKLAVASYLLVVAQRGSGPVSMLVHPSHTKGLHEVYERFIVMLLEQWSETLCAPGPDRDELIENFLEPAYLDLDREGAALRPMSELVQEIPDWIGATQVRVINAETPRANDVRWDAYPSWILIGGNKLDRGFTVEGLTTTFMPRPTGAGQVDSVQQRARFFGYKASYGLLCRAWLNTSTADMFEHYVEHEQMLRADLKVVQNTGGNLRDWKRKMLLDASYKPTRKAVISLPHFHDRVKGDNWISLTRYPFDSDSNIRTMDDFIAPLGVCKADDRDTRTGGRNTCSNVELARVLTLFVDWEGAAEDKALMNQVALLVGARLDIDPSLKAEVYLMDGYKSRQRTPGVSGTLTLQQGRNPKGGYPGDGEFFTPGVIAVQFSNLLVKGNDSEARMVGVSLRIPGKLAGSYLWQAN